MNNLGSYIQLLIFAMFIGFSVFAWIIRKLNEQAARRRYLQELERRRLEALRTGRPLAEPTATKPLTPEQRLAEIARRRQEAIARQRQGGAQVRTSGPATTPSGPRQSVPTARPRTPSGTAARRTRPAPVPGSGGKLTPAQRRAQVLEARRRELAARQRSEVESAETHLAELEPISHEPLSEMRSIKSASPTATSKQQKPSLVGRLDAQSLRRAVVLKEILDPPVSLRQDEFA
ncbi:MAG: hypothetical protein D6695_06395 [Planctomycetota bacterium]|nr:MAG: hypothetical protein D6695_06395 [Planctomycetota bacterium]